MTETFRVEVPPEVAREQLVVTRERVNDYIRGCQNSIRLAVELKRGNVTPEVMDIPGMAAAKNRIMLNHLVSYPKARYLEVGVYVGATFCAALHGNKPQYACAIDNFSQFDGTEAEFKKNTDRFVDTKFDFFNRDCFNLTRTQKEKLKKQRINMYVYDGPHTAEDHYKAITEYYEFLDDIFIIVVDDWNLPEVRKGTFVGLKEKSILVHWQIDLKADTTDGTKDMKGWWNGVWVAVCQKRKIEVKK